MSRARTQPNGFSLLAVVLAAIVVLLWSGAAFADPDPAQIEAQIQAAWREAEPLIEQYNAVHEEYQRNQSRQEELRQQLEPLQQQVAAGQAQVGTIAAAAYRGARMNALGAFLSSGSAGDLADQLTLVNLLARDENRQLSDVSQAKALLDEQKAPIDALVAELSRQDTELAQQRQVIEAKLSELQQLRRQAYGSSGGATGSYRPWPCPSEYLPTAGYQAAAFACQQAGIPYVWAAAGPDGYDCSGLTLAAWQRVGVYLPHNAAAQRRSMPYINRSDLQLGDLVFFYDDLHHVAIYVGDGKVMSAPTFGDVVRMVSMDLMPIHSYGRPG